MLLMAMGIVNAFAQERTITGTVKDAGTGETLIGVNIVLTQDKSKGTVSDIDGNYQISVPATADSLDFSYVGYTSQTVAITTSVYQHQPDARQTIGGSSSRGLRHPENQGSYKRRFQGKK